MNSLHRPSRSAMPELEKSVITAAILQKADEDDILDVLTAKAHGLRLIISEANQELIELERRLDRVCKKGAGREALVTAAERILA